MNYFDSATIYKFEQEFASVILYYCLYDKTYSCLNERELSDTFNIKDKVNRKIKYFLEPSIPKGDYVKKESLLFAIRVKFPGSDYEDIGLRIQLGENKEIDEVYYKKNSQARKDEKISNYDLKNLILKSDHIVVNSNLKYEFIEEYQHDIHAMYEEIELRLDDEIKNTHIQEIINSKENIEFSRKDKKVCLLLSALLLELYGYKFEVIPFSYIPALKKKCLSLLKETILPCLDYQINDEELEKIIDTKIVELTKNRGAK